MKRPRTRAEFERNFHLLHRQIEDGKLQFSAAVTHTLDGLARVRFLPNGRIDFLSVDEIARLQANTTGHFDEETLKEILRESKTAEQQSNTEDNAESSR